MSNTSKKLAAAKMDELLNTLSGAHCEYIVLSDAYLNGLQFPELAHDNHDEPLRPGNEYMIITTKGGTELYVNVNHCSAYTSCAEVFGYIQYHL